MDKLEVNFSSKLGRLKENGAFNIEGRRLVLEYILVKKAANVGAHRLACSFMPDMSSSISNSSSYSMPFKGLGAKRLASTSLGPDLL